MDIHRRQGALFGLVWGDVLGCPVEGWRSHEIENVYGKYTELPTAYPLEKISAKRRKKLRPLGLHSDDTQQALALLLLLLSGPWAPVRWKQYLVRGLDAKAWRGTGRNFDAAVYQLRKGVDWKRSGSPSAGIGAAMRTGPIGAIYFKENEREQRLMVVLESSLMTHSDQRAAVFGAVISEAVALFIQEVSPDKLLEELAHFAFLAEEKVFQMFIDGWKVEEPNSHLISESLHQAKEWIHLPIEEMRSAISNWSRPHLAKGFTRAHPNQGFVLLGGLHALLMSCRKDLGPDEALLSIIREGFDTDTVAAIAGSLLGARYGDQWIPVSQFLDHDRIQKYSISLIDSNAPESEEAFFYKEANWTKQEVEFQTQLKE